MKQFLLSIWFFFLGYALVAQVPVGYYDAAAGLKGDALKTALYNIIKGQKSYPYTSSSSTDVWDILKETDRDTANPENVILIYSGRSVNAAREYNHGNGWSREHVWAKSRGDFGTEPPAGTDVNNIRPADISVNSTRSNRWFDTCSVAVIDNGIPTGSYKSNTRWVWQPRKEVEGDVARMIFYMATRYEGDNGEPDLKVVNYIPADKRTKAPVFAKLSTLLKWNTRDPVDNFERHRNEVIYSYQHNRNPFIDHPEYAQLIWGTSVISGIISHTQRTFVAYPNPVVSILHFSGSEQDVKYLYSMQGVLLKSTVSQQMPVNDLPAGLYFLVFKDKNTGKTLGHLKVVKAIR